MYAMYLISFAVWAETAFWVKAWIVVSTDLYFKGVLMFEFGMDVLSVFSYHDIINLMQSDTLAVCWVRCNTENYFFLHPFPRRWY